jgi:hypothetical protein
MTKDEALTLALDFLMTRRMGAELVIDALQEALAQPAQEPDIYPEEAADMGLEAVAYYTTPPQRPWVELTEQHRNNIEDECEMMIGKPTFDAINTKLKELNT